MNIAAKRWSLLSASACAAFAVTTWAQVDMGPPPAAPGTPVPAREGAAPPATATAPAPSAESVLEDLLRQRGNTDDTAAVAGVPTESLPPTAGAEAGPDGLLREGQFIQGRTGKLKRDETSGATIVVFDKKGAVYSDMAAVPSRRLELMENAAGFGDPKNSLDLVFPIDAEVTQYRGKNYLFIGQSAAALPKPATTMPAPPATLPSTVAGILPQPDIEAVAPNAPEPIKIGEGELIELRAGRFVKDAKTGAEIIVFDADGRRMLDQPMGLLPCKYLAVMEDASDNGAKPIRFRVSGQVTQYRGKNYLYLKAVTIIHDIHGGLGG